MQYSVGNGNKYVKWHETTLIIRIFESVRYAFEVAMYLKIHCSVFLFATIRKKSDAFLEHVGAFLQMYMTLLCKRMLLYTQLHVEKVLA